MPPGHYDKVRIQNRNKGLTKIYSKRLNVRMEAREEGRQKAKEGDMLHYGGCMLYWAEGAKEKCSVDFCNMSVKMIEKFYHFLLNSLNVKKDKINVVVKYHSKKFCAENLSSEELIDFWSERLNTSTSKIKPRLVTDKRVSGRNKNRHIHGLCRLQVHDVTAIEHIYGALEEYEGESYHPIKDEIIFNNGE